MKVRDSGMPDELLWSSFFDARAALVRLGINHTTGDMVDFGCGYGTFTTAAAALTRGIVHALDIEQAMVTSTTQAAALMGLDNVSAHQRDFVASGSGLADGAVDFAMLFNILHMQEPLTLLREAKRILRPGGKIAVMHWIYDARTPRGPDLSIRPQPKQCRAWLGDAGFELVEPEIAIPPIPLRRRRHGRLTRSPSH